jgi:hypothetical protein
MPTPLTLTGPDARELLMECCTLLSREHPDDIGDEDAPTSHRLFRAELIVRDGLARLGEDYENPTLLGVLRVADMICRERAESHPEFAAQMQELSSLIDQQVRCE